MLAHKVDSTAENLAVFIWDRLEPGLQGEARLFEVMVRETEKNFAIYRGERGD